MAAAGTVVPISCATGTVQTATTQQRREDRKVNADGYLCHTRLLPAHAAERSFLPLHIFQFKLTAFHVLWHNM